MSKHKDSLTIIPVHVGIIMDGNGRWALRQGKPRSAGHEEGLKAAKRVVKAASDFGIKYISLYAFSTENWKRAKKEVAFLMVMIKTHLKKEYDFYKRNRIRVIHSGDLEGLSDDVKAEIITVERDTAHFTGLTVNLAINYGGRDEIVRAVNRWLNRYNQSEKGITEIKISEENIKKNLDRPDIPYPDLIIRTGGEIRISNFLLWELAYSELYFNQDLWPDWGKEQLLESLKAYQNRERRFGREK
jgi:undecaprenyl diphosphate synthase